MLTPEVWTQAERHLIAGDAAALQRLLDQHAEEFRAEQPPAYVPRGPRPDYSSLDARAIVLQEQMFASWSAFEAFQAALRDPGSPVARFEAAADAIAGGDLPALRELLAAQPALATARSPRTHRATLLHYIGANGIEGWRQKTPPAAVQIAAALLDAGADVNASAEMYGGSRTLGLVATSLHPELAGLQDALVELLKARGARKGR